MMEQGFKSNLESEGHIALALEGFLELLLIINCLYDFKCISLGKWLEVQRP